LLLPEGWYVAGIVGVTTLSVVLVVVVLVEDEDLVVELDSLLFEVVDVLRVDVVG
jgi:hypothetical protein